MGAQSSMSKRNTVKDLKKCKSSGQRINNTVNLSWEINIQIMKKL